MGRMKYNPSISSPFIKKESYDKVIRDHLDKCSLGAAHNLVKSINYHMTLDQQKAPIRDLILGWLRERYNQNDKTYAFAMSNVEFQILAATGENFTYSSSEIPDQIQNHSNDFEKLLFINLSGYEKNCYQTLLAIQPFFDNTKHSSAIWLSTLHKIFSQTCCKWHSLFDAKTLINMVCGYVNQLNQKQYDDIHLALSLCYWALEIILKDSLKTIVGSNEIFENYLPLVMKTLVNEQILLTPTLLVDLKYLIKFMFNQSFLSNPKIHEYESYYLNLIPMLVLYKCTKLVRMLSNLFGEDKVQERIVAFLEYAQKNSERFSSKNDYYLIFTYALLMLKPNSKFILENSNTIFETIKDFNCVLSALLKKKDNIKFILLVRDYRFFKQHEYYKVCQKYIISILENSIETFSKTVAEFPDFFKSLVSSHSFYFNEPFQKFEDKSSLDSFVQSLGGFESVFSLLKSYKSAILFTSFIRSQPKESFSKAHVKKVISEYSNKRYPTEKYILIGALNHLLSDEPEELENIATLFNRSKLMTTDFAKFSKDTLSNQFSFPYGFLIFTRGAIECYNKIGKNLIGYITRVAEFADKIDSSRAIELLTLVAPKESFKSPQKVDEYVSQEVLDKIMEMNSEILPLNFQWLFNVDPTKMFSKYREEILKKKVEPQFKLVSFLSLDPNLFEKILPSLIQIVSFLETNKLGKPYFSCLTNISTKLNHKYSSSNFVKLHFGIELSQGNPIESAISKLLDTKFSKKLKILRELAIYSKNNSIDLIQIIINDNLFHLFKNNKEIECLIYHSSANQSSLNRLIEIRPEFKFSYSGVFQAIPLPRIIFKKIILDTWKGIAFNEIYTVKPVQSIALVSWNFFNILSEILSNEPYVKPLSDYLINGYHGPLVDVYSKYCLLKRVNYGTHKFIKSLVVPGTYEKVFSELEHLVVPDTKEKKPLTSCYPKNLKSLDLHISDTDQLENFLCLAGGSLESLQIQILGYKEVLDFTHLETIIQSNPLLNRIKIEVMAICPALNPLIRQTQNRIQWKINCGHLRGRNHKIEYLEFDKEQFQEFLSYTTKFKKSFVIGNDPQFDETPYLTKVKSLLVGSNMESLKALIQTSTNLEELVLSQYGNNETDLIEWMNALKVPLSLRRVTLLNMGYYSQNSQKDFVKLIDQSNKIKSLVSEHRDISVENFQYDHYDKVTGLYYFSK